MGLSFEQVFLLMEMFWKWKCFGNGNGNGGVEWV